MLDPRPWLRASILAFGLATALAPARPTAAEEFRLSGSGVTDAFSGAFDASRRVVR